MSRPVPTTLASIVLLAAIGAPGLALAAELPLDGLEVSLTQPATLEDAETMSTEDLANMSGGADVHINANAALSHQELTANSTGNTVEATNLVNGAVTLAPGSLDNFTGIGNFVVNTGTNNILQGSINVTIATSTVAP